MKTKSRRITITLIILSLISSVLIACGKQDAQLPESREIRFIGYTDSEEPLPSRYDLREEGKVSPARSQGGTGACWAYAALSSVESNLILNGYESSDVDLSENHLLYFSQIYNEDTPMENSSVDGVYCFGEKTKRYLIPYDMGGMVPLALAMLANGVGPISEELSPINVLKISESAKAIYDAELDGSLTRYMGDYLVTNYNGVLADAKTDDIKREILRYGAFATGMYFNNSFEKITEGNGIYSKVRRENNHAISIIGWDDDFSRENFKPDQPEQDGAWLIKDSSILAKDHYFWISYEETSEGMSVEVSPKTKYGRVLFYDSIGPIGGFTGSDGWQEDMDSIAANPAISDEAKEKYGEKLINVEKSGLVSYDDTTTIANVFTSPDDNELVAVGLFTLKDEQRLKIRIYIKPKKDDPESGKLVDEIDAQVARMGYHTIDLNESVKVSKGEAFSVTVEYYPDDEYPGVAPVEIASGSNDSAVPWGYNFVRSVYFHVGSNPGESYGKKAGKWYDLSLQETAEVFGKKEIVHNAIIKAYLAK